MNGRRLEGLWRGLLIAGAVLSLIAPIGAHAQARDTSSQQNQDRRLRFYNTHTGESLKTMYWEKGRYISGALGEINHILRDFRVNEVRPIEPALLDVLHAIAGKLDTREPFHIISGYRSPATNAMLAAHSEGVARHSLHQFGKAADIRVPDRELNTLHRVAIALRGGGVGYYPRSDFVHVDIGRVRYW